MTCRMHAAVNVIPGLNLTEEQIKAIEDKYGKDFDMVENLRVQNMLKAALEKSKATSYIATLHNVELPETGLVQDCVLYAKKDANGGTRFRMDCHDGTKLTASYIDNGLKWTLFRQKWARVLEVFDVHYIEALSESFYEKEIENSKFSVSEGEYHGMPCHRIVMQTLTNARLLAFMNKEMYCGFLREDETLPDINGKLAEQRPITRIFLIDKENLFIYSREHLNINGERLYYRDAGDIKLNVPIKDSLFDVPEELRYSADRVFIDSLTARTHLSKEIKEAVTQTKERVGKRDNSARRIWLKSIAVCVIVLLSILAVCKLRSTSPKKADML